MPDYRRNRVPGGTFLFTVNLLDRRSDLLVTQIDALQDAIRCGSTHPSTSTLGSFFPTICTACGPYRQRRYWEHRIRNDRDFAAHLDYTHFNPVKHGLVKHPADWPHSSFRQCVAKGFYPAG